MITTVKIDSMTGEVISSKVGGSVETFEEALQQLDLSLFTWRSGSDLPTRREDIGNRLVVIDDHGKMHPFVVYRNGSWEDVIFHTRDKGAHEEVITRKIVFWQYWELLRKNKDYFNCVR